MVKILLAEDDSNLGQLLQDFLKMKGYQATLCRDGQEAVEEFEQHDYDLALLDVMMPVKDGFSVAAEIRRQDPQLPIIFLTAKSLKEDKIHGLEIGADDYMTKPFSMDELLLRIKAVLRRTAHQVSAPPLRKFQIGKLFFDYDAQILKTPEGEMHLTSKETELLRMLCEHKNRTLERSKALKEIWYDDNYFNARSMDVYITKLRKYLKEDDNLRIINVHGTGFKLVELV